MKMSSRMVVALAGLMMVAVQVVVLVQADDEASRQANSLDLMKHLGGGSSSSSSTSSRTGVKDVIMMVNEEQGNIRRNVQSGQSMGQMKLSGSATVCGMLSIPQATCPSINDCMMYYTEYYLGTPGYYQFVSNSQYINSVCCPNLNGAVYNGVFSATQSAGANFGTSTLTITRVSYSNLVMRMADQSGMVCSLNYYVVWGNVLGGYPSSANNYNSYGTYYAFVWVPLMCICLCICITASVRNRRERATTYTPQGVIFRPSPPAQPMTGVAYAVPAATMGGTAAAPVPVATAAPMTANDATVPQVEVEYDPVTKEYRTKTAGGNSSSLAQV